MISEYPKYYKKFEFEEEEKNINSLLEYLKIFRNFKAEMKLGKEFKCFINNDNDYTLVIKALKLTDNITANKLDITSYEVANSKYSIIVYYEKKESNEDILLKEKQIEILKASIGRRKNLLSNNGYISKAPAHLVEEERSKLEKEELELKKLL